MLEMLVRNVRNVRNRVRKIEIKEIELGFICLVVYILVVCQRPRCPTRSTR
jgi:hypothetical protein